MPFANFIPLPSRTTGDDDHDQIGSNSSTPPGAATPRPDPTDKRLPGILHSYFGQVRDSFRTQPKSEDSPAPALPAQSQAQSHETTAQKDGQSNGVASLPTAPSSPMEADPGTNGDPLPEPTKHAEERPRQPSLNPFSFFYPTPPTSSSSSMHQTSKEELGEKTSRPNTSRTLSTRDPAKVASSSPLKSRRHTFVHSAPLCSVVTKSDVSAAHISNPSTRRPSNSTASPSAPLVKPERHVIDAQLQEFEGLKLTEGGELPSCSQNTPPQTPRTQSHEGKHIQTPSRLGRFSTSQGTSSVARPTNGKLSVSITEGRGLRPSIDPYVVCQFQWAEYISDGPRGDGAGKQQGPGHGPGGLAMQRTESELGRSVAIPMRSRQSSNTGFSSDPRENGKYTTNPHWDHDAIL